MSFKTLLRRAAIGCRLDRLARQHHRALVPVLMYHGVVADDDDLAQGDWLQVRASEFRAQMAYLAEHYAVCRVDEILAQPPSGTDRPRALITFDDGYANNLHFALPILQEFNLPAIVFLVTGHIDTLRLFWWDRLQLACRGKQAPDPNQVRALKERSPRDIKAAVDAYLAAKKLSAPDSAPESYRALSLKEAGKLAASGLIEFGSHTHGHEILERLSAEEVSATLEVSAERLAKWGHGARHFAAPNGSYRDDQIPLIEAAGYATCFATETGLWQPQTRRYRIPRLGIGRGTGIEHFALQLSGLKNWIQKPNALEA